MNQLITRNHLRSLIGCTVQTIRNYEKAGMPVVHIGGLVRYDEKKVEKWLLAYKGSKK